MFGLWQVGWVHEHCSCVDREANILKRMMFVQHCCEVLPQQGSQLKVALSVLACLEARLFLISCLQISVTLPPPSSCSYIRQCLCLQPSHIARTSVHVASDRKSFGPKQPQFPLLAQNSHTLPFLSVPSLVLHSAPIFSVEHFCRKAAVYLEHFFICLWIGVFWPGTVAFL
mgnify:CR=1 FL=1